MSDYFEYWMLPEGTDNETTRIVNVTKDGKYLLFHRDDGKICKYDLSSGEVIGFRGKNVKSLSSQLKDLTVDRLINITSDKVYKQFLNYVYSRRPKHRAWLFVSETLPDFVDYEQYFTSGFTNLDRLFHHGYSEISKGLIKLCNTLDLQLNDELFDKYNENPDAYNLVINIKFANYTPVEMIKTIMYGSVKNNLSGEVNPNDLTNRAITQLPPRRVNIHDSKSYFTFELTPDARICHIKTCYDLKKLPELQPIVVSSYYKIDFENAMKAYDAIQLHLSEQPRCSYEEDLYFKLYAWDCDSILILNPSVIKEVNYENG